MPSFSAYSSEMTRQVVSMKHKLHLPHSSFFHITASSLTGQARVPPFSLALRSVIWRSVMETLPKVLTTYRYSPYEDKYTGNRSDNYDNKWQRI